MPHVSILTTLSENAHSTLPFTDLGTDPYNEMNDLLKARVVADATDGEADLKLPRLSVGQWTVDVVALGEGLFVLP